MQIASTGVIGTLCLAVCLSACASGSLQGHHVTVRQAGVVAPMAAAASNPNADATPNPQAAARVMDAPSLFHAALEAAHADKPADAAFYYGALIDTFPQDALVIPALYNRGLQREALKDLPGAIADYRRIVQSAPHQSPERTWLDAHFRLGVCLTRIHGGWAAVSVFDEALREELDDDERLEAMVGRGIAMQDIAADDAAEVAFGDALRFFESGQRRDIQSDRDLAAEAAYRLGMINTARFDKVTLHFPQATLRHLLEEKCQHLLAAQNNYLRAIHLGDAHTLAVAGFGIGDLYERLYDAIVNLEPSESMDAEALEIYREEVRQRVAVLVKKAIMVYERALMAGRAAGTAEEWVTRLEKALERLRTIYLHSVPKG